MELDKDDLICLVNGSMPNYSVMDHPKVKTTGNYIVGEWKWNSGELSRLSEIELKGLYQICKDSWK